MLGVINTHLLNTEDVLFILDEVECFSVHKPADVSGTSMNRERKFYRHGRGWTKLNLVRVKPAVPDDMAIQVEQRIAINDPIEKDFDVIALAPAEGYIYLITRQAQFSLFSYDPRNSRYVAIVNIEADKLASLVGGINTNCVLPMQMIPENVVGEQAVFSISLWNKESASAIAQDIPVAAAQI